MNDKNSLSLYLRELYRFDTLPKEEEIELAYRFQDNNDYQALEKLINHNLRIVVWLAKRESSWDNSKVPLEDIIAMGNEALMLAARSWRPNGSARFGTYAKPYIRLGIRRGVAKTENHIALPIGITEKVRKMQYCDRVLTQRLGKPPTVEELAKETGFTVKRINTLKGILTREPVSLDALTGATQSKEDSNDE